LFIIDLWNFKLKVDDNMMVRSRNLVQELICVVDKNY